MPEPLPEYRIKARNTAAGGENPIHDDAVARQLGFPGGLVPGVTVYAYLTRPVVSALGSAWLTRGTASVRFLRPVLEGEEVVVAGAVTARDTTGVTARVTASTSASGGCAVADITLPAGSPTPVNLSLYGSAPLPPERPPVSRALLERQAPLGTPEAVWDEARATTYLQAIDDPLAVYRGAQGRVHPAFYLNQANRALDRNVRLGPWIHVASRIRHLGAAQVGERLITRGRVRSLWEKKGRDYVELDLVITAGARPVAHVLHTAIYRLGADVVASPRPAC
jgi:acyl-coenzyme A thioesterase PaaI-like protein